MVFSRCNELTLIPFILDTSIKMKICTNIYSILITFIISSFSV